MQLITYPQHRFAPRVSLHTSNAAAYSKLLVSFV